MVDAAIDDVSRVRDDLGAFQADTLETASRSLQISRDNLTAFESTIRDTDMASAAGESVLARIRLQASILAQQVSSNRTGVLLDLLA